MQPLTEDELQAIEARTKAATPRPWGFDEDSGDIMSDAGTHIGHAATVDEFPCLDPDSLEEEQTIIVECEANGLLMSAARTDIPRLLATIRAQQAELERVRTMGQALIDALDQNDDWTHSTAMAAIRLKPLLPPWSRKEPRMDRLATDILESVAGDTEAAAGLRETARRVADGDVRVQTGLIFKLAGDAHALIELIDSQAAELERARDAIERLIDKSWLGTHWRSWQNIHVPRSFEEEMVKAKQLWESSITPTTGQTTAEGGE